MSSDDDPFPRGRRQTEWDGRERRRSASPIYQNTINTGQVGVILTFLAMLGTIGYTIWQGSAAIANINNGLLIETQSRIGGDSSLKDGFAATVSQLRIENTAAITQLRSELSNDRALMAQRMDATSSLNEQKAHETQQTLAQIQSSIAQIQTDMRALTAANPPRSRR